MNKTKYQPGDKVRVKSDLEDRNYSMENSGVGWAVMPVMKLLRGKDVTIKEASPDGYTIESSPFKWTDEMFEEIVLEYVECTKWDGTMYKTGVIYKVVNGLIPNEGVFSPAHQKHNAFKPSTKEAFDKQFLPKIEPWSVGSYVVYLKGNLENNGFKAGEVQQIIRSYDGAFDVSNGMGNTVKGVYSVVEHIKWFATLPETEAFAETIKPKPIEKWAVGTYVVFVIEYGGNPAGSISKIIKDYGGGVRVELLFNMGSHCNLTKESECKWFAAEEEAITFAKTLKPAITVESEMARLGLAIGDQIRVDSNTKNDKGFYNPNNHSFIQLCNWSTTEIVGGLMVDNKLYLKTMGNASGVVLSDMVTKINPIKEAPVFKLGDYEVTVTKSRVKVGCTILYRDKVVSLLIGFLYISDAFETNNEDNIYINDSIVYYKDAEALLEYINAN